MAARAAVRDVGRVLDMSYTFCDGISKLIPNKPGKHITIADALKQEPILAERLPARGRGQDAAGAGAEARGHDPQRRHARRRRADRAGQAHRLHAAVPAAGQRLRGEPVRQGRRGGGRPGEVRLPGPGDAHHPGAGAAVHRAAPSRAGGLQLRNGAAGRPADLQAVLRRQDRGGVPVRIPRHAGHAARRAADAAGGPDRPERAVPPGPDGPDPRASWPASTAAKRWSTRIRWWSRCWPRPTASWSTRSR